VTRWNAKGSPASAPATRSPTYLAHAARRGSLAVDDKRGVGGSTGTRTPSCSTIAVLAPTASWSAGASSGFAKKGPLPPQRRPARTPQRHARDRGQGRWGGARRSRPERHADRRVPFAYVAAHLDYGYALTGHAAQGLTVDRAYVLLHDQGALQEWGYVACTRARLQTRLYLGDRDRLERETPLREPDHASPSERAASALQRPAAKPLALDPRSGREDAITRFAAQQQDQLDRQCERTAKRLAAAHASSNISTGGTPSSRTELETEIALHRRAFECAAEKREQLIDLAEQRTKMLALARELDRSLGSRRPEPASRSPGIKLERERGLGIER
jgi:hypothetical protein